jgi:hypothetical protein
MSRSLLDRLRTARAAMQGLVRQPERTEGAFEISGPLAAAPVPRKERA